MEHGSNKTTSHISTACSQSLPLVQRELNQEIQSILKRDTSNHIFNYNSLKVYLMTITASIGFFFFGYSTGVINPIHITLRQLFNWDDQQNTFYSSIIAAAIGIGSIVGSISTGPLMSRYGRRKTIMIFNVLAGIGTVFNLILNEHIMIVGRTIIGICVGGFNTVIPVYISEFVPYDKQGTCGAIYEFHFSLGLFVSYLFGLGLPEDNDFIGQWWRFMIAFPVLFCVINYLVLLFFFRHDTPSYCYLIRKSPEEAKRSLESIYNTKQDVLVMMKDLELLVQSNHCQLSIGSLMFSKEYRIRFFLCIFIMFAQPLCGIEAYLTFSETIFITNGESQVTAEQFTTFLGVAQCVGSLLAILILDRVGRKKLIIVGQVALIAVSLVLTLSYIAQVKEVIFFLYLMFVIISGVSLAPACYVYCTDILPESGIRMALICNNLGNFIATYSFMYISESVVKMEGTIFIYISIMICSVLMVVLFGRETKDLTIIEIHKKFSKEHLNKTKITEVI
jgi:MFS family permease